MLKSRLFVLTRKSRTNVARSKPTGPKGPDTASEGGTTIETVELTWGLVKKNREVHHVHAITGEMFKDIVQRASSPAR